MTTLRVQNTVPDYDAWKAAFDKFERARRDRGVRSYRVSRGHADRSTVVIDLEFDDAMRAQEFGEFLAGVWRTPQSQRVVAAHHAPVVLEVVEDVVLT